MLYEIHMPQPGSPQPRVEYVHGDNWLDALRRGLSAAGLPAPTRNLACDLQDDESVIITDTGSGQVFRVAPVRGSSGGMAAIGRSSVDAVPVIRVQTPTSERSAVDPRPSVDRPAPPGGDEGLRDMADPFVDEPDDGVASGVLPMHLHARRSGVVTVTSDTLPSVPSMDPDEGAPRPVDPASGWSIRTADYDPDAGPEPDPASDPRRQEHLRRRCEAIDRELAELEHLGRDIHDACNFTLDVARAHVPCGAGSVLLIDARDRCLYFAAARGPKAALVSNRRIPLEVGIAGAAIRERRPLNIGDPRRDRRFASNLADAIGYHPRSLVCAPIFSGRKAFGVLELLDREQLDGFSDDDVEVLALAARRLGEHFASLLPGGGRHRN